MTLRSLLEVPAPAKLNLFLHVVGRRADGYHLLRSLFALIDWADTLHFERRDDAALLRHDLGEKLPADDLCLRAARLLQRVSGSTFGADISVDKRLPSGAGLGGGSSDAATTLLALNRLWQLNWPRARLLALAEPLGADVPFFVGGENALVEGIGERLTAVSVPPMQLAVVKPPVAITTRALFSALRLEPEGRAAILAGSLADADLALNHLDQAAGRNDLQTTAERRCPEVAHAARWLQKRFGNSRMTGSGSAVFARVGTDSPPVATFPVDELPPGWVGRMCRSLGKHPLEAWAD